MCKKKNAKAVRRMSLGRHVGSEIELEAEFSALGRPTVGDQNQTTVLFKNVSFSGNLAADHVWVNESNIKDRSAWGRFQRGVRYVFKATPYAYVSTYKGKLCEKFSLGGLSLVDTKPAVAFC